MDAGRGAGFDLGLEVSSLGSGDVGMIVVAGRGSVKVSASFSALPAAGFFFFFFFFLGFFFFFFLDAEGIPPASSSPTSLTVALLLLAEQNSLDMDG